MKRTIALMLSAMLFVGCSGAEAKTLPYSQTIEETSLWTAGGVSVTATRFYTDSMGFPQLELRLENLESEPRTVFCDALLINGFAVLTPLETMIAPKTSTLSNCFIDSAQLSAVGIDNIGEVELSLRVTDQNGKKLAESELLALKTSDAAVLDDIAEKAGDIVFSNEYIQLHAVYNKSDGSYIRGYFQLVADFKGDDTALLSCGELLINGRPCQISSGLLLYPKSKAVGSFLLITEELAAQGIDSIESLSIAFSVISDKDGKQIAESELLTFL